MRAVKINQPIPLRRWDYPEAKIGTAIAALGLWAIGIVGLAPHLNRYSKTS